MQGSRTAVAAGESAAQIARSIADELRDPDLRIAFVFADWQLDAHELARELHAVLAPARIVGGTTIGVIGPGRSTEKNFAAVALGMYGDAVRVGIGVARELPLGGLTRARDAMVAAARDLGTPLEAMTSSRHVGITFVDGKCGQEETFCIGSAAAAPQIRVVGGCAASEVASPRKPFVFVDGAALQDAGIVAMLETELPFHPLRSQHLLATDSRMVVTSSSGRVIEELDGKPAFQRLQALVHQLGGELQGDQFQLYNFARFVDGIPYVRSIVGFDGDRILLASGVDNGHVLRLMRPGDLIGTTQKDLANAVAQVGGQTSALLAFSCIGRHWEAATRGVSDELSLAYAAYGAIGFQSYGEQSGMLLVNHTLTGLAIGVAERPA